MEMRKIEIDFDIHQMIEMERRGFGEPEFMALRRLLKLPEKEKPAPEVAVVEEVGIPFVEDGVRVPHGSEARMHYLHGRQQYSGRFLNGMLVVNGKSFTSLSKAAGSVAVKKNGQKDPSLNGWLYWEVKFPGQSNWRKMDQLREELRASA